MDMNLNELSNEKTEKLLQLQDLTGIEDLAVCRSLLENHNWNLESAIHDHLQISDISTQTTIETSRNANNNPVFSYLAFMGQRVFHWSLSIVSLPFWICFEIARRFLLLLTEFLHSATSYFFIPRVPSDPVGDIITFKDEYEKKYGHTHPNFYRGSYSDALNAAKQELSFLLAYLHCDDHKDTDRFCQETLQCPRVISFINERLIFWACSIKKAEGYRVSQSLRENGYPFLALIVLKHNRMTAVARMEGFITSEELLNTLTRVMNENESSLIRARLEREERQLNQVLREEQDHAYQQSLRADREKQRRKEEEKQKKEEEENKKKLKERKAMEEKENIRKLKMDLLSELTDEPDPQHPDAIRIVIRLPNGVRLQRCFLQTDSLKILYYYVFCHPESPDKFEIATSFPRRILLCCPSSDYNPPTFAEMGFKGSETLCVTDLDA